jgi:hypothetical protein
MNRLIDLRFVIGAFFTIVGILLLLYGILDPAQANQSVNKWCGGIFIVFGVIMLLLSRQKNVHDEL